jgi:hypothetical protein
VVAGNNHRAKPMRAAVSADDGNLLITVIPPAWLAVYFRPRRKVLGTLFDRQATLTEVARRDDVAD